MYIFFKHSYCETKTNGITNYVIQEFKNKNILFL